MRVRLAVVFLMTFYLAQSPINRVAADTLKVVSDFEGASARVVDIDQEARSISFMPGGDPARGWPCWWYFRIDGIAPGETITLKLQGSLAAMGSQKPLSASWAMPERATYAIDGVTWQHTDKGERRDEWMIYLLNPDATSVHVAWGPPYTPTTAAKFVSDASERSPFAIAEELCRSREGRAVPLLHVMEGERDSADRFGVWVQARQHAWESGSSWVAQGFGEWLISDKDEAAWMRRHAEIFLVPIMDIDNTATGNGGKNAIPQDHNRDWSAQPHWNEVSAAQRRLRTLIDAGRMDIFLDLHNPAPGDPTFFYALPRDMLEEPMLSMRDRFIDRAYSKISSIRPMMPMSKTAKETGPSYHPLWKQMSGAWVTVNGNPHTVSLCLETSWNSANSTVSGYRAVGAALASAVQEQLLERVEKQ